MSQLDGKYLLSNTVADTALTSTAKANIRAGKLVALRSAVAAFSASSSSSVVTTPITGAATTLVPQTSLTAKGVYTGSISGATDVKRVMIRLAGTDNGVPDGNSDEIFGVLSESSGVYTLSYKKADGSTFTFGSTTSVDFYFVEIFDGDTSPVDAFLRNGSVSGVIDAGTAASLAAHTGAGADKHADTQITYSRADGSKRNIQAASDDVAAALNDLDDVIGGATGSAGLAAVTPTNYTPSASTVVGHLAGIDAAITGSGLAKPELAASTTGNLAGYTYANGTAGVGATLTAGANGAFAADGYSGVLNDLILVPFQSTAFQNGIYKLTTVGDGGNPAVLTRYVGFDTASEMNPGTIVNIANGTLYAQAQFVLQAPVATVGTTAVTFSRVKADPEFLASGFRVKDGSDPTKKVALDVSGVATATTRTITQPNRNVDLGNVTQEIVEVFTLSGGDITAKQVTLANTPKVVANTQLVVKGAPPQVYGDDYSVTGPVLSWDSLGLDGLLIATDKLVVRYLING